MSLTYSAAAVTVPARRLPAVTASTHALALARTWSRRIAADVCRLAVSIAAVAGAAAAMAALTGLGMITESGAASLAGLLPIAGVSMLLLCLAANNASGRLRLPSITEAALAALAAFMLATMIGGGVADAGSSAMIGWIASAVVGAGIAAAGLGRIIMMPSIRSRLRRNVAIFGVSAEAERLHREFGGSAEYNFAGLYEDRRESRVGTFGVPVSGNVEALLEQVRKGLVDEVVIALPADATARFNEIKARLKQFPIDVRASIPMGAGDNAELPLVPLHAAPIRDWGVILKMMEDRIIGVIALAFAAPLFALIAIAIRLESRGPVFFRQKRHGVCGKPIVVWKFRSMRVLEDGAVVRQATKGDPRITRVGAILRKTSLDELPQLINVVLGEMSLVGPRPHAIAHNDYYGRVIGNYDERNQVRPGITGWAQINGFRGETQDTQQMAARVNHDIWYISNWSLLLDLKILLLTPIYGLVHKNAY